MMRGTPNDPGPLTMEIAAILRGSMARQGILQADLAHRVARTQQSISRMLSGERHINVEQLYALAGALDLSAVEVLREAEQVIQ